MPGPTRSTPIDIAADDSVVVTVAPADDKLSVINTSTDTLAASVSFTAGTKPDSVAIAGDNATGYVTLKKGKQLVRVNGLNTLNPTIDSTFSAALGSEPAGVALSPNGSTAVVTNFGETFVSFVDTATGNSTNVDVGGHPFAVAVSNNGDTNDNDEFAYVTLFYGVPTASFPDAGPTTEVSDSSRMGVVVEISLASRSITRTFFLNPIANTGIADANGNNAGCSPNQLYGIVLNAQDNKLYVPNICASPHGATFKRTNVFSVVSVIDLTTGLEDNSSVGTAVLNKLAGDQGGATAQLLGNPVAMDFRNHTEVGYVLSQAAGLIQRLVYNSAANPPILLGSANGFGQIALTGDIPFGIVVGHSITKAYVVHDVSKNVSSVDLSLLAENTPLIQTTPLPTAGSTADNIRLGKKFFFTGKGRWSDHSVSSCASCHPNGLSDDITWVFAAGPRHTVPLDGMFDHANPTVQRALNWTAIFDEMHDFENNTRGVQGGLGAIVDSATGNTPIDLTAGLDLTGTGVFTRNDNLSGSSAQVVATLSAPNHVEWDQIKQWTQSAVKANAAPTVLDPAAVARGRTLFANNNCTMCHSGDQWTTSHVPYTPSQAANGTAPFDGGATPTGFRTEAFDAGPTFHVVNTDSFKVAKEVVNFPDGGSVTVAPERITCVLREVGTFDITDPVEVLANGTQAQGFKGFNPPSLLGLATNGPYLHNGSVTDLHDLFSAKYAKHHQAFSALFLANGGESGSDATEHQQVDDLVQFLLSIDESTPTFTPPANSDACGLVSIRIEATPTVRRSGRPAGRGEGSRHDMVSRLPQGHPCLREAGAGVHG